MKEFKQAQEVLNRLDVLLTEIQIKSSEVVNAIAYNREYRIIGLEIDVKELQAEKKELEFEFRELTLTLRI